MDKNTIIGLILIFVVILGFSWLNRPSEEELARQKHVQDSIAAVNAEAAKRQVEAEQKRAEQDSLTATGEVAIDSATMIRKYGRFLHLASGVERLDTVENGKIRIVFTNHGGRVKSVEMLGQTRYDKKTDSKKPYIFFDGDEAKTNFIFSPSSSEAINTSDLYFEPIVKRGDKSQTVTMRLMVDSVSWMDFSYNIPNDSYMTELTISTHNMDDVLAQNMRTMDVQMSQMVRQNEKGRKFEVRYSTLNYRYTGDDVEALSESSTDTEQPNGKVNWVAFKDHFFSQIIIADESFTGTTVESEVLPDRSEYIRNHKLTASLMFDPMGKEATHVRTYYGPNQYKVLSSYDDEAENEDEELELYKIIPMGWKIFSWLTTLFIIPLFNFLGQWFTNYGIIILLMTIILKIVVFPLMYKSFSSSAKMRHLRPEIEKINEKIPAEKAMERQQATMALYSKAGASPMSGCLPMLLQWPILFAMFSFFPTCFELRGQSFLWADDLSSYDAIVTWDAYIPLITPYFGNHISLFCLLMTIVNIVYTKINMAGQASNDKSAKMMKWMMYLMPLMFMFMFNNYSSGLSYYYFVSLLITIFETFMFRLFITRDKVMATIEKNKAKPAKKKSGFMARLEAAQRQQQEMMKKQMAEQQKKRR